MEADAGYCINKIAKKNKYRKKVLQWTDKFFTDLLEMKEFKAVKSILEDMDTATIAELLGELKEKERREAFGLNWNT